MGTPAILASRVDTERSSVKTPQKQLKLLRLLTKSKITPQETIKLTTETNRINLTQRVVKLTA
jgi:hypothetical protein